MNKWSTWEQKADAWCELHWPGSVNMAKLLLVRVSILTVFAIIVWATLKLYYH